MKTGSFLRFLWPQSNDEDFLVIAKKRAIILFGVAGGLITLLSGVRHLVMGGGDMPFKDFMLIIVCPLFFFATPWFVTRTKNINAVFAVFITYGYLLVLANHFNGGGIVSHASFFLVALSCLVAVNYGWAGAGISILVTITHFTLLIIFREHFPPVVDFTAPGAIDIWLASGLIFILLLTAIGGAAGQSEMRRAAERLAEARTAAEAASRAKSEFLANMSHEIRTPMNGVLGMAELLQDTEPTEEQKVFIDTIHSSGSALVTIINDILDFSKIEAGKLELDPAPFNMRRTLEEVATLLSVTARDKGFELVLRQQEGMPVWLIGDVSRIRQAVINLVGNAIKFTHEGHVLIDVRGAFEGGAANVRICVEDTGIGIAPDKVDAVFDQFTQAESSTTRKYGGTGLGLAITRRLIEAMGGTISVESKLGEGSKFAIDLTLPVADAPAINPDLGRVKAQEQTAPSLEQAAHDGGAVRAQARGEEKGALPIGAVSRTKRTGAKAVKTLSLKPKILIADDNEANRLVMRHMIDLNAFEAAFAENGKAAYAEARKSAYEIILMDISMPEMDGIETVKAIRDYERLNGLGGAFIIAMTGHAMPGDRERFLEAGMNDYIQKPVSRKSIDDALRKWADYTAKAERKAG